MLCKRSAGLGAEERSVAGRTFPKRIDGRAILTADKTSCLMLARSLDWYTGFLGYLNEPGAIIWLPTASV